MYMIYVYIYVSYTRVSWDVVGTPEMSPTSGLVPGCSATSAGVVCQLVVSEGPRAGG